MEVSQEKSSMSPATERANELLNSAERRLGMFALQTRQRLQEMMAAIRVEADRMDQPLQMEEARSGEQEGAAGQAEQPGRAPATEKMRAEELVDRWAHRISTTAAITGWQTQRIVARMREEAEDIWAEAQDLQKRFGERARAVQQGVSAEERVRPQAGDQGAP